MPENHCQTKKGAHQVTPRAHLNRQDPFEIHRIDPRSCFWGTTRPSPAGSVEEFGLHPFIMLLNCLSRLLKGGFFLGCRGAPNQWDRVN